MSTANETADSPAKAAPQNEGSEADRLSPADFAAILSSTLALAAEAGLSIGVRATQATPARPPGLLVFVAGLTVDEAGALKAA